jgi:hypothetical protein
MRIHHAPLIRIFTRLMCYRQCHRLLYKVGLGFIREKSDNCLHVRPAVYLRGSSGKARNARAILQTYLQECRVYIDFACVICISCQLSNNCIHIVERRTKYTSPCWFQHDGNFWTDKKKVMGVVIGYGIGISKRNCPGPVVKSFWIRVDNIGYETVLIVHSLIYFALIHVQNKFN